jgi:hypothetical protein
VNKICFIVPYFGKFNNYFPIWLHSCSWNPDIDWLIFTDDKRSFNYPPNVKVQYCIFADIVEKIQNRFDFKIALNHPYQLCEFKISYGEVFTDFLSEYHFWGFCDIDVVWGDIRRHITDEVLNNYSKISWRGHLTMFKNDSKINALYRSPIDDVLFYKHVFSNTSGYPVAPDEGPIDYIFEQKGEKIYKGLLFADLKIRSFKFKLLHFPATEEYKNKQQIFLWKNGRLYRIYIYKSTIHTEEFAYVHFLKRPMQVPKDFKPGESFLIVPNRFISFTSDLTTELVERLSRDRYYWSYIFERCKPKYFLSKMSYWYTKYQFRKKYKFLPTKSVKINIESDTAINKRIKEGV